MDKHAEFQNLFEQTLNIQRKQQSSYAMILFVSLEQTMLDSGAGKRNDQNLSYKLFTRRFLSLPRTRLEY